MENNKLFIYREVLVFPRDIMNLQEKIDQLITISKLCEYDISCKLVADHTRLYCFRINFSKNDLALIVIDFDYDLKNEYIDKICFFYKEQEGKIFGNEINEIVKEIDKLMQII